MEDMLESDRLPNNVMKVPEVYSLYCQSSYREGERGGDGEGEKEGRGRGEKGRRGGGGEERRGERGKGRGGEEEEEEEVHMLYCHNVSLSLQ